MQALSITCDPLDTSGLLHHMLQNVSKETVRACSKENLEFLARIFKLQFSSDDDDEDVEALVDSFLREVTVEMHLALWRTVQHQQQAR